jgi:plasmid stabilization system protein ParE
MTRGSKVRRGVVMLSLVVAGPAVFYRLRDLRPGDQIRVVRVRHSYRDNLVVSAVRVADGAGRAEAGR